MVKHLLFILLWAVPCALAAPPAAWAQQDTGMDEIESMFSNDENASESVRPAPTPVPSSAGAKAADGGQSDVKGTEVKDVSDLGKLQGFKDIAVISRRFLPKSQRFEAYLAPALNLNDAFFYNFGLEARIGYYLKERYGVEATLAFMTASDRDVTTDLREQRGVQTTAFVTPSSFYMLDFKWSPIYGKMSWQNKKITPFDLYFSFGLGMTGTNQGGSSLSFHLGTGQVFAYSKSGGLRWDFSWYAFSAQSSVDKSTSNYNNLVFSIGWSWFFPEATYR